MIRLAVVFQSDPFDRKGLFNAVHQRVRHLLEAGEVEIDVYCLYTKDSALTRKVRHLSKVPYKKEVILDGIVYRMMWYRFSILDAILTDKLHCKPFWMPRTFKRFAALLKDYDCISAHSYEGAFLANLTHNIYGTNYYITWHGSDIHTKPWANNYIMKATKEMAENAFMNFYVSETLKEIGNRIAPNAKHDVLSNGVSENFHRFSEIKRCSLREKFGISGDRKVVAYAGNFQGVKNVLALPEIFKKVIEKYKGNVTFWIVGDGKQRRQLLDLLYDMVEKMNISIRCPWRPGKKGSGNAEIVLWGNAKPEAMPYILNCVDVLVVPSKNEGCPLICAEAILSGASVIGADVCGVRDVIDSKYLIPHGADFSEGMSTKIVSALENGTDQTLPDFLNWKSTATEEYAFLEKYFVKPLLNEK